MSKAEKPAPTCVDPESPVRERILRAAFGAFMERGYAGASTLEIATRAKVSKRELYALFESKQAILAACMAGRADRMRMPLELPPARDIISLARTLTGFGSNFLAELTQPSTTTLFRLAIVEAERSPEVAQSLCAVREETGNAMMKLLAAAQSSGLLGAGNPGEMTGQYFALLIRGIQLDLLLRLTEPPNAEETERRARAATDAFLRLNAAKNSPARERPGRTP